MKKNYKKIRSEMGLTQRELAKKLGMCSSMYCNIENYKRPLKLDKAITFAYLYSKSTGKQINFLNDVKHLV